MFNSDKPRKIVEMVPRPSFLRHSDQRARKVRRCISWSPVCIWNLVALEPEVKYRGNSLYSSPCGSAPRSHVDRFTEAVARAAHEEGLICCHVGESEGGKEGRKEGRN